MGMTVSTLSSPPRIAGAVCQEITIANDGIVNQKTIMAYARRSFDMIRELDRWGVRFKKDETGEYDVKKVHPVGAYVLPMPEGHSIKKVLYRQLKKHRVEITNRYMATRLLTDNGRIAGAAAINTRTGEFLVIRAKAVILCTGAAGRLGLPASGYLFGTYENPTNAGDGYSMAYHAGAELSGIECFQINPLIKDYNGPSCAHDRTVRGYTANAKGYRFIAAITERTDDAGFYNELQAKRPGILKLDHLADETVSEIEDILIPTNVPAGKVSPAPGRITGTAWWRCTFRDRPGDIASGVDEYARTPCRVCRGRSLRAQLHAWAFVYGAIAGEDAAGYCRAHALADLDREQIARERDRVLLPLKRNDGIPPGQMEYKLRRMVNDYMIPPKVTRKMVIGLLRFAEIREDLSLLVARDPHELMRALEVHAILDCAEMAARASLFRTESRWGLYHFRVDYPETDNRNWFVHVQLKKGTDGEMSCFKRPVDPYLVEPDEQARRAFGSMRITEKLQA